MASRCPWLSGLGPALGLLSWMHGATALAQPTVRIQAGAQLELQGVEAGDVRGRLADDLGRPLAAQRVEILARPAGEQDWARASTTTAHDGSFRLPIGATRGEVELRASYAGDRLVAATRAAGRFDAGLAPVLLQLNAPAINRVDIDGGRFVVRISAASSAGGAGLPVSLQTTAGAVLAAGVTDAMGRFERELPTELLDPPGPHALVLRSEADATRGAAQLQATVIAYLRSTLEARAAQDGERLVVRGALSTARGPLARKAVGIFLDGAHLATVPTDELGRFEHAARPPPSVQRASGELNAQARFDSDEAWLGSSRSQGIALRWVATSRAPSPWWLLLPTLLCALLVLAWSARRAQEQPQRAPVQVRGPGIHALGARVRGRASFDGVAGVVLDSRSAQPIPETLVLLEGPDATRIELAATPDGRFAATGLRHGSWLMTVLAPGHAAQRQELSIPHQGAWAHVQVLLLSLRWAAMDAYRPAAERVLPSPHLWGQWTLREIRDSATRSGRGGQALEHATSLTELTAYGRDAPSAESVRAIESASAEVGRPRVPPGEGSG